MSLIPFAELREALRVAANDVLNEDVPPFPGPAVVAPTVEHLTLTMLTECLIERLPTTTCSGTALRHALCAGLGHLHDTYGDSNEPGLNALIGAAPESEWVRIAWWVPPTMPPPKAPLDTHPRAAVDDSPALDDREQQAVAAVLTGMVDALDARRRQWVGSEVPAHRQAITHLAARSLGVKTAHDALAAAGLATARYRGSTSPRRAQDEDAS